MDTLDPVETKTAAVIGTAETLSDSVKQGLDEAQAEVADVTDAAKDKAEKIVGKIDWRKVGRYATAGLAIAGVVGGYAYWRHLQKQPETRLARLKRQLGLAHVDFRHLKSTLDQFDFDELDRSRRKVGAAAKKATHLSAKRVAELTR